MTEIDNSKVNKHLGRISEYKSSYDPSLLVAEPRQSNRVHLDLNDNDLPFVGNDTWNAYEVSGLTDKGLPVTGVAKIVYTCESPFIVESKSLKLYLNSFNMTKLGLSAYHVRHNIERMVATDLSRLLKVPVYVKVFSNDDVLRDHYFHSMNEWGHSPELSNSYITLEETYYGDDITCDTYTESPELLKVIDSEIDEVYYHSALLKSNCRVTSQPDWGDVYIYMKGKKTVDPISLLKYIVSFRDECHFHEEICETIYKRLWDRVQPDELSVKCLYARRGGIDINPERVSDKSLLHYALSDEKVPHCKTPKQ